MENISSKLEHSKNLDEFLVDGKENPDRESKNLEDID